MEIQISLGLCLRIGAMNLLVSIPAISHTNLFTVTFELIYSHNAIVSGTTRLSLKNIYSLAFLDPFAL